MMAVTHSALAAAGVSLLLGTADPLLLGLAVVGSQLPDLDTTESTMGKIFFPLASWIEDRFPHRSITHSLLATAAIATLSILLGRFGLGADWKAVLALPLGHLLACFSDCFTKQGVQLFWPEPAWCISVSNPKRRLTTGGASELWVLAGAVAALCLGIYLATGGGVTQKVSQQLGLKDGIVRIYNQNAATHHVWANIEGVRASDRADASGRYLILGANGSEFVVRDAQGRIYQTGQQLVVERLTAEVGEPAATQVQTLTFNDLEAIAPLEQLRQNHPDAEIFLTGTLTVDFPEEVVVEVQPEQLPTLSVSGATVSLNYCPIESAIAALRDQWAMGTLSVKIVRPKPQF